MCKTISLPRRCTSLGIYWELQLTHVWSLVISNQPIWVCSDGITRFKFFLRAENESLLRPLQLKIPKFLLLQPTEYIWDLLQSPVQNQNEAKRPFTTVSVIHRLSIWQSMRSAPLRIINLLNKRIWQNCFEEVDLWSTPVTKTYTGFCSNDHKLSSIERPVVLPGC